MLKSKPDSDLTARVHLPGKQGRVRNWTYCPMAGIQVLASNCFHFSPKPNPNATDPDFMLCGRTEAYRARSKCPYATKPILRTIKDPCTEGFDRFDFQETDCSYKPKTAKQ